jgi:hypothetical protein
MKTHRIAITLLIAFLIFSFGKEWTIKAQGSKNPKVELINLEKEKKVDVMIDGKLFTSYRWPDNVTKPVLYPIFTSAGTTITRGFPLDPRPGERNDHPHQIGMWLTYGNVDGSDFWGNGSQGPGTKNPNGGVIKHLKVEKISGGAGEGMLRTSGVWIDKSGIELLNENTELHFIAKGTTRIIEWITTLTAGNKAVPMPDTKEGMFGIRVARQLELPAKEDIVLKEKSGGTTTVKAMPAENITGNYRSSEGITGQAVWSTRAKWMDLYGSIGDEKISLVICDHPKNLNYPTYWHAREYGLFAANPFGVKDFTVGKEELNYTLPAGKSLIFRYRIIITSGSHLTDAEINTYSEEFARKY